MLAIVVVAVGSWSLILHASSETESKGLGGKTAHATSTKPQFRKDARTSDAHDGTRTIPNGNPNQTGDLNGTENAPVGTGNSDTVVLADDGGLDLLSRDPLELLRLDNIKPLYTSPVLPGEGIWETCNSPRDEKGSPIFYKTFYRPSVDFPNAIVHMMIVDMSKAFMQYYVGSQEPAAPDATSEVEGELRSRMLAITNAMWQQRHSHGAGAIFRGRVLYPMVDGMATLIVYRDGSVDIQEWSKTHSREARTGRATASPLDREERCGGSGGQPERQTGRLGNRSGIPSRRRWKRPGWQPFLVCSSSKRIRDQKGRQSRLCNRSPYW